jgi:hypothetical protein
MLGSIAPVGQPSGLTDSGQRVEHRRDAAGAFPVEGAGDFAGVLRDGCGGKQRGNGADLFGQRLRPGDDRHGGRHGHSVAQIEIGIGRNAGFVQCLKFGAQPADEPLGLLRRAFAVQRDELG